VKLNLMFASKAYRDGWIAAERGAGEINNPYADAATEDNRRRGMGGSPWWDTRYEPFHRWVRGWMDARRATRHDRPL
jgi:hypothetical protein